MSDLRVKDDQASLVGVRDVGAGFRAYVDASEVTTGTGLTLQTTNDLGPDVLLVEVLRLVLGGPGDVGL